MRYSAVFLFVTSVIADVSVQPKSAANCGGSILSNVRNNPGAANQDSGCQAPGAFSSTQVIDITSGFKCNVYSDSSCQNFIGQIAGAGCSDLAGEGIQCFSQELFDNPLAKSTAAVTLGLSTVPMARSPGLDAKDAISKACRDTGCDSSAQDTITFQFGAQETAFGAPCNPIISDCGQTDCTATLTVDGNFDNTNQRDYMQSILSKVLDEAQAQNADKTLSFAQVVLNDATGANQAQMSIKIDANCEKASSFDCDGLVATLIGGVLGEIPAVGGLVATAFDAGCQVASGKARRWVA